MCHANMCARPLLHSLPSNTVVVCTRRAFGSFNTLTLKDTWKITFLILHNIPRTLQSFVSKLSQLQQLHSLLMFIFVPDMSVVDGHGKFVGMPWSFCNSIQSGSAF